MVVSGDFFAQLSFCVSSGAQLSGKFLELAFLKKRVQLLCFPNFYVLSLNFETFLMFAKTLSE